MFTQRDMDTWKVESEVEVQKMLQEWMEDYLGSRLDGANKRRAGAEGAEAQAAEGAGITPETGQAPY
jgi:hypothetical protein